MPNYQLGKIYKLISANCAKHYIGSTTVDQLCKRLRGHKARYQAWLNGYHNYVTSFELVKQPDCTIVLLETFPCNSKDELFKREQYYLDLFKNDIVNKQKAHTGMTQKEHMKLLVHNHYIKNKEQIAMYHKQRYEKKKNLLKICDICAEKYKYFQYIDHCKTAQHVKHLNMQKQIKKTNEEYKKIIKQV